VSPPEAEQTPEMSVVLVSPDGLEAVRRTLQHLRNQTARDRIELVIVAPSHAGPGSHSIDLDGFAAVRLVEAGPLRSTGTAFAAAVRVAGGPIVGCVEEHSFPEPGWAEAIIEAHRRPWDAVGGALENANPATRTSWAALISDFGSAVPPIEPGEASELPGHQTAYKRSVLLRYGSELDHMLEVEWVLQEDLRASGGRLFREPRAVSHHLNASRLRSHLWAQLNGGRLFAGNRARLRGWSRARRLLWVAGSPLLPLVRLAQALPHARRAYPAAIAPLIPVLALGLTANSLGQMLGYAFGAGQAGQQRTTIDLQRRRHLRAREQLQLDATPLGELPRLA
jgi:hypothetical protein